MLAEKIVLPKSYQVAPKLVIKVYPIINCASVLFREHLLLKNPRDYINEYSGIKKGEER